MKKEKQTVPYRQQLSNERTRRGWSQQDVADRIGTTPVNVSRWERGITTPNPYFRQQLAALFGKNLEELGLHPQEPPPSSLSSQVQPTTTTNSHNIASPLPAQQDEPLVPTPAPVPTPPASLFSRWHSSRYPLAARMVTLISLVLLFVLIGLVWFNSTHSTIPGGRGQVFTSEPVPATIPGGQGQALTSEPIPAFYNVKGQLALNDPLNQEPTKGKWNLNKPSNVTGCHIINGAYHMKEESSEYCLAAYPSPVEDFVYQIDMTIVQGSQAGIVFRTTDGRARYYYFGISPEGTYLLYRSDPTPGAPNPTLKSGSSAAIHKGYNASNQLAVKVMGADISLYINSQLVNQAHDTFYTSGNIGVRVLVNDTQQGSTEAAYRNAKMWTT